MNKLLTEETQGIDEFISRILQTFPTAEPFIDFIIDFIEKSDCNKIEVKRFKYGALGLALHNGVVFNEVIFSQPLPYFLFIVFHEIAHQYQYKKYGTEKMYEFYLGEVDVKEAAKLMKYIEVIADEFASRKLRELQKMGYLSGDKSQWGFYKNSPVQNFEQLITRTKSEILRSGNFTPEGVAELFYNMIVIFT